MYTIEESVNEVDELEKIVKKVPFKKNRNISLTKNISRNKTQTFSPNNKIYKNKNIKNNFYNFSLSYKEGNSINKSLNINTSTDNISSQDNFNFNFFHPGNLIFEIFINLSEFDLNKYDFFVSYTNLCGLLSEINIIDKKLYTDVIITQNDLDIILKTIKKNNNSSKRLNFKEFLKFFSYLVYKIDYTHFVEKPERTLKFNINKLFSNYFKENKMSFISLIYNYVLYIQNEKNINELLNPIINNLKNIFIKFFQINEETPKENENILNTNDSSNKNVSKNKFKYIIDSMKYLGIFPFLVNIKELVIIYNIYLDDNNENEFLEVEEINTYFDFSFKKFCLLFLCLCFYIKDKKQAILKQYWHLLNDNKRNINFETELKYGQKEGVIRFILQLNFKYSLQNDNFYENNKIKIKNHTNKLSEEKFYTEIENLDINDIDFLFKVFESFSSHFDKYLNYQISFSDMITFLKECGFLINENKNQNLSLEEKYYIAKNKIKKNINYLKASLYSSDQLFKKNNFNNNSNRINKLSLRDVEIFYSKVSKRADINNRLNFKEFIKFLYLSLDKLKFNSINDLINVLFHKKRNKMYQLMKQFKELEEINKLYDELKTSDIFNIIIQVFPIINIYFISLTNKINKYIITYDLFIKIFTEFDLYPNLVGNNLLRNIFYKLYQIESDKIKLKEQKLKKIFEEKKEIEFDEILKALGIITLYLAKESNFDEKKILFGLLYRIAESKKIKLELNNNFNFSDAFKNKLIEISNSYFDSSNLEEPEYKLFLKNPYI